MEGSGIGHCAVKLNLGTNVEREGEGHQCKSWPRQKTRYLATTIRPASAVCSQRVGRSDASKRLDNYKE